MTSLRYEGPVIGCTCFQSSEMRQVRRGAPMSTICGYAWRGTLMIIPALKGCKALGSNAYR
jgi:hypothetical protein